MGAMFVRIWNLLSSVIIYDTSQTEVTSLHTSLNVILNCARHQLETKQQPNVFSDFPCFYFRTDCNKELYLLFPILMNFRFPAHHSNICKHYFGYQLHQIHASNAHDSKDKNQTNTQKNTTIIKLEIRYSQELAKARGKPLHSFFSSAKT